MRGCGFALVIVAVVFLLFGLAERSTPNSQRFSEEAQQLSLMSTLAGTGLFFIIGLVLIVAGNKK